MTASLSLGEVPVIIEKCTTSSRSAAGRGRALVLAAGIVLALSFAALLALSSVPRQAQAAGRGIVDNRLEIVSGVEPAEITALAKEIGRQRLHAKWTRVLVHWPRLQPNAPGVSFADDADGDGYSDSYVSELKAVVAALTANGVRVILTPTDVPVWASDQALWSSPPSGWGPGYSPSYAMDTGDRTVLQQFGRLGAFLASSFGDAGAYLECWNEPNTGGSFYPQRRRGDRYFGLRVYTKMLRAFHDGAKSANSRAVVIAGATAPRGADDAFSTSPRTFATYLHDHGAARYFDAYSHHPYPWAAPEKLPPNSKQTVWLGNLGVLLDLFPNKDFYLTEFGYGTASPTLLGLEVSKATQARYLRQAYSLVAERYPQVKALLWFMVQDLAPTADRLGAYMGLSTVHGVRKPGWFAFAGGNRLSLNAPPATRRSARFRVSGILASRAFGALAGKQIMLQSHRPGQARWRMVSAGPTRSDGSYAFRITQTSTRLYRVVWDGVCASARARVRTP